MNDKVLGCFATTRWSLVRHAGASSLEEKRAALTELLQQYLPPLRSHLVFRKRIPPDRADDLLQGFLVSKVLERDLLERADQTRGKFRSFLLTALDRFVLNELRSERAQKRAPVRGSVQLDEGIDVVHSGTTEQDPFDVEWGRRILERAVENMADGCKQSHRFDIWGVFEGRMLRPMLEQAEPVSYQSLINQFGFASPAQASNVLVTANRMFQRHVREVIAEYAASDEEIDQEIADLLRAFEARH